MHPPPPAAAGRTVNARLLVVPYDSGHRGVRMGRGPLHLLEQGLEARLRRAGYGVETRVLEARSEPLTETGVAFELARTLADAVRGARDDGDFPLVLAGNCFSALGTVAGLDPARTAVLWLDAHGDLNTPDTTTSGFLDGMAVATLTGRCWRAVAATIPGFTALPDARVALLGARELDPGEALLLEETGIARVDGATIRGEGLDGAAGRAIRSAAAGADHVYLHVDLDVLDAGVARANQYAVPGGLTVDDVAAIAAAAAGAAPIAAAALTAFDPSADDDGAATRAAMAIALLILERAGPRS